MHRYVLKVAQVILISFILMILLDTVLNVVEVISVHSRVSAVMSTIQTEVARNNFMPDALGQTYTNYFNQIADDSGIMDPGDISTNFASPLAIDGNNFDALTATNAGEYGDLVDIAVYVEMHPEFMGLIVLDIELDYIYSVPCLRYLK